jgi:hypothetical protein
MTATIDYARRVSDAQQNLPPFSPSRDAARKEILKNLERLTAYGSTPWQIFDDWLDLVLDSLTSVRDRFRCTLDQAPYEEPEESVKLFARLRHRYGDGSTRRTNPFDYFAQATAALWQTTADGYWDTVGDCYQEWGVANKWNGQFFTPFHVADLMASVLGGPAAEVQKNLVEAISKSIPAQARLMAGLAYSVMSDETIYRAYFTTRILPHILSHYEPVKVHDPACGSGVMFLAYARNTPPWMINMGLVQFFGQDIDVTCVRMAQINMMLYGLNGVWAPMFYLEQERIMQQFHAGEWKPDPATEESPAAPPVMDPIEPDEVINEAAPDPEPVVTAVDERVRTYINTLQDVPYVQLNLFTTKEKAR